jgi:demethylmenaquinone methyltransferase/2-methoxy-6-polyprenyl-1,4-benzoquinol methylase
METDNQLKTPSREDVWKMFDQISPTYDKVNRAMTAGLDVIWRKKMGSFLPKGKDLYVLDCATGTGDQLISLMDNYPHITKAAGIDLSEQMLEIGRKKISHLLYKEKVTLLNASALDIPFPDDTFDCVTMSFGIRNVTSPSVCLQEIYRVLKPGGRVLILESSVPETPVIKQLHLLYLRKVLPRIGGWLSCKKDAYVYLNQTIETFPYGKAFCHLLEINRFCSAKMLPLMLGAVTIYYADKS